MKTLFSNIKSDFSSGLVVFLVALPLCLGIALASGAPLISGIVAGIVGGIVVGFLSPSQLSVTGPAAGLTAIVAGGVQDLGSFKLVILAVIVAGVLQLIMGLLKLGSISNYIPTSVIEGMLAGIGLVIIIKQISHAFGYDKDNEGDFGLSLHVNPDGSSAIDVLIKSAENIHVGATIICVCSLIILISWEKLKKYIFFQIVPSALIVVIFSICLNAFWISSGSNYAIISHDHLVNIPSFTEIKNEIHLPDFSNFQILEIWKLGFLIAVVASIETLLCVEATDKLDLQKRLTDGNKELIAQGIGNIISGLLGGLPITSVVVRSSANISSGAKSKLSTIIHGFILLICVINIPFILNQIPLSALAAVLLLVGYKLAKPSVIKHMWKNGLSQFIPFIICMFSVVFLDLLKGVGLGLVTSIIYILYQNLKLAYYIDAENTDENKTIHMQLAQEVSFLNKAAIKKTLMNLKENSSVIIDARNTNFIDFDVMEVLKDFKNDGAKNKNIHVKLIGFHDDYHIEDTNKIHIKNLK